MSEQAVNNNVVNNQAVDTEELIALMERADEAYRNALEFESYTEVVRCRDKLREYRAMMLAS